MIISATNSLGFRTSLMAPELLSVKRMFRSNNAEEVFQKYIVGNELKPEDQRVIQKVTKGDVASKEITKEWIQRCVSSGHLKTPLFTLLNQEDPVEVISLFEKAFEKNDTKKVNLLLPVLKDQTQVVDMCLEKYMKKKISKEMISLLFPKCSPKILHHFRTEAISELKSQQVYELSKRYNIPVDYQDLRLAVKFYSHVPTMVSIMRLLEERGLASFEIKQEGKKATIIMKSFNGTATCSWDSIESLLNDQENVYLDQYIEEPRKSLKESKVDSRFEETSERGSEFAFGTTLVGIASIALELFSKEDETTAPLDLEKDRLIEDLANKETLARRELTSEETKAFGEIQTSFRSEKNETAPMLSTLEKIIQFVAERTPVFLKSFWSALYSSIEPIIHRFQYLYGATEKLLDRIYPIKGLFSFSLN